MKRMTFIVVALLMACTLAGCNTFRGFGEDVQHVGGAISHAAS